MTYWPYIVNWILPSSSSSSSESEYYENDDETDDQSPNDNDDQSPDIDSVVSPSAIPDPSSSSSKRRRTEENDEALTRVVSQKRVWTKEDELELLHGFLDFTSKRCKAMVNTTNGRNQKDQISSFFDKCVGPELKLRFNKNQIVDKLRRLKRKYRNIEAKNDTSFMGFRFKNSHDKATFDICREIWKSSDTTYRLRDNIGENVTPNTRSRSTRLKKGTNSTTSTKDESSDTIGLVMDLGLNSYAVELMKFGDEYDNGDENLKDKKIIELEAYLKGLEMVQAKVKASLDKLRS